MLLFCNFIYTFFTLNYKTTIDHNLLQRVSEGDSSAFVTLYEEITPSLNIFLINYLKCPDMADDVMQEIFIKVWEKRTELPRVDNFRSWIFTITKNHTLNVLKKIAADNAAIVEIIQNYNFASNSPENILLEKEYFQELKKRVEALPSQTQRVFALCREENNTYEQVAEKLGISRNAIKKHIVRANKKLKESFITELNIPHGFCWIYLFSILFK